MARQTKAGEAAWQEARQLTPEKIELARNVLEEVRAGRPVFDAIRQHPLSDGYLSKNILVAVYRALVDRGEWQADPELLAKIRMKPMRTLSGVTTVTVLTKPYPCPGDCIFCPTDVRMPTSYLPDEPGAMRALHHDFDPYEQVQARIEALHAVGHPTDKIELLILGGTWDAYPRSYQTRFIQRCLDAMNGTDSPDLATAQRLNETAVHRNVGMVIETRPDEISPDELEKARARDCTSVGRGDGNRGLRW